MRLDIEVKASDGQREIFANPPNDLFFRVNEAGFVYVMARNRDSNEAALAAFYRPISVKFLEVSEDSK